MIQAALDEKKKPVEPPVEPVPPIGPRPEPPVFPDPPIRSEILETGEKDVGQEELKNMFNKLQKIVDDHGNVRISLTWKIYKAGN